MNYAIEPYIPPTPVFEAHRASGLIRYTLAEVQASAERGRVVMVERNAAVDEPGQWVTTHFYPDAATTLHDMASNCPYIDWAHNWAVAKWDRQARTVAAATKRLRAETARVLALMN